MRLQCSRLKSPVGGIMARIYMGSSAAQGSSLVTGRESQLMGLQAAPCT